MLRIFSLCVWLLCVRVCVCACEGVCVSPVTFSNLLKNLPLSTRGVYPLDTLRINAALQCRTPSNVESLPRQVLDTALLHDEHMLRSVLQSRKWQLIGMS